MERTRTLGAIHWKKPSTHSLSSEFWLMLVRSTRRVQNRQRRRHRAPSSEKSNVWSRASPVLISKPRRRRGEKRNAALAADESWQTVGISFVSSGGRGSHSDRPRWLGYGVSICMLINCWWSMQGSGTNKNAISVASPLVTLGVISPNATPPPREHA